MFDYQWLDQGIYQVIKDFEYPMKIVNLHNKVCACIDFTTKQGQVKCPICLGTGKKIRIKNIRGASEETSASFRSHGVDEKSLADVYFIRSKYKLRENDIIVDGDRCLIIHRIERKKSADKRYVYNKCLCVSMKSDKKIFMENFKKITGEA